MVPTMTREIPTAKTEIRRRHMRTKIEQTRLFFIGQNRRGNWVAKMKHGMIGGLFINKAAALKFALFENGNHPEAVITVPGVLELDLGTDTMGSYALAA
jgi:hypothetical protein